MKLWCLRSDNQAGDVVNLIRGAREIETSNSKVKQEEGGCFFLPPSILFRPSPDCVMPTHIEGSLLSPLIQALSHLQAPLQHTQE